MIKQARIACHRVSTNGVGALMMASPRKMKVPRLHQMQSEIMFGCDFRQTLAIDG